MLKFRGGEDYSGISLSPVDFERRREPTIGGWTAKDRGFVETA